MDAWKLCIGSQKSQPSEIRRRLSPTQNSAVSLGCTLALQWKAVLASNYSTISLPFFFFFKSPFLFLFGSKTVGLMPTPLHSGNCLHWLCDVPWSSCQKVKRLNGVGKSSCNFYKNYLSSQKERAITISGGWGALAQWSQILDRRSNQA